jgi:predicted ATPase
VRRPGNLPVQLTSFVGRAQETRAVRDLLERDDTRLVTLTGPGGVGKTRLALRVAALVGNAFADGVVAAELAPVADRDGVVHAIGRALGAFGARQPSVADLIGSLESKRLLLLLDNFEHVLDAAPLVAELLRGCPRLGVLATSRAALRISGEQEFPVSPLPVPDPTRLPAVAALADYAAVALFVDRAARVRPDFALTADNAAAVAAVCARLDGLPLALELAAARVRTLPPRVLLERLSAAADSPSLRLLAGGPRDAPARQRTLHDTIAWSHDLLGLEDRTLFRRLAVFVGGSSLEAAEAVCAAPVDVGGSQLAVNTGRTHAIDIVDGLDSLVEKSLLVQGEGPGGEPRFAMLETIRAYAWEQLVAAGEAAALRRRHAEYYLAMVEATGALLFAGARKRVRLAAEQANVQAALRWLVQHG